MTLSQKLIRWIIVITMVILAFSCANPIADPERSKAVSAAKQVELLKDQNNLLKEQNVQLKRIADALDRLKK